MEPQWWPTPNSRAADNDRERAVEALKVHFQAGRIQADELSDRIGLALNAQTFGDLNRAMVDLPPVGLPVVPIAGPPQHLRKRNGLGIAALLCGFFGFFCGIPAVLGVGLGVASLVGDGDSDDRGFAIAGIVMSMLWLAAFAILFT
ncbi:DUF1707 and DUF4190 domain-containing protein [Nocardia uniformis]|uniref:DUF1707 and DUF4190 domain-containing protein n=1 Tax=Nocardia uniformis TaxID=53432 RepID=A0A849CEW4_9NOCA|nr:DUF1707 and DUF4190 domain-containing protein [Nocardia uniformis]NNH73989.1 DUF1707 and DUF4190 domain-containing protein [Nocardia uniformis]